MSSNKFASWEPAVLSVLRIVAGFMFSAHGFQKILGLFGGHVAPHFTLAWFAGILELIGGPLILAGLFTRPVAFLLSGEMAVGYFKAHAPAGFLPIVNHGELAVLYCFVFLYFMSSGAGAWSLDALIRKKK